MKATQQKNKLSYDLSIQLNFENKLYRQYLVASLCAIDLRLFKANHIELVGLCYIFRKNIFLKSCADLG